MELFIDLAAAFTAEPVEGNLMRYPPRNPQAPFLGRAMITSNPGDCRPDRPVAAPAKRAKTGSLTGPQWLLILALTVGGIFWLEVRKLITFGLSPHPISTKN